MSTSCFGDLPKRLLTSITSIFFITCLLYFAHHPYLRYPVLALISGIICLTLQEYYHLALKKGVNPAVKPAIFLTLIQCAFVYYYSLNPAIAWVEWLILFSALCVFSASTFSKIKGSLVDIAVSLFGFLFVSISLSSLIRILYFYPEPHKYLNIWLLIYLISVTKSVDTTAFLFGRLMGKHPLASTISPKKTLEGAFIGTITGLAVSLAFTIYSPLPISLCHGMFLGLLLPVIAQFGDLTESLLKRDAQVKDSSTLPGLGGFLDIFDSIIFTAPSLVIFLEATQ